MSAIDRDLLAEGRRIDESATAGPWYACENTSIGGHCVQASNLPYSEAPIGSDVADMVLRDADADAIAWMRTNLTALLDGLEAERSVEHARLRNAVAEALIAFCESQGYERPLLSERYAVGSQVWRTLQSDSESGKNSKSLTPTPCTDCGYPDGRQSDCRTCAGKPIPNGGES